jgi:hypothetical protein
LPTGGGGGGGGWADVFGGLAQGVGGYFAAKTAGRQGLAAQKAYNKGLRLQLQAQQLGIGASGLSPGLGGTNWNNASMTPVSYLDVEGGSQAGLGGSLVPAVTGAARAVVASPALKRMVAYLSRYIAPTAAVALAADLVADGFQGASGPYENPKHNTCTGILRGDVLAVRRVKRSGKRLLKTLRMAGVGPRRAVRGGTRRRRAC